MPLTSKPAAIRSGNTLIATSMGDDIRTHMKHYGKWTDEAGLAAAFGATNARIAAGLREDQGH